MATKLCNCNALTLPHVHDSTGIRPASESESKTTSSNKPASSSGFTPVVKG